MANTKKPNESLEGTLFVVKAGGDVLDGSDYILNDVACIAAQGAKVALVYGGQTGLNELMKSHGITPKFVNGLRVSTADVMKLFMQEMVGRGEKIASYFGNACVIHHATFAKKIPGMGYTGEAVYVDNMVKQEIAEGKVVVVSPLAKANKTLEGYGIDDTLNCNADSVASRLACYLKPEGLYIATNVDGVKIYGLLIPALDAAGMKELVAQGVATDGMAQKVLNAASVAEKGIDTVIFNGLRQGSLLKAIEGNAGTTIYRI